MRRPQKFENNLPTFVLNVMNQNVGGHLDETIERPKDLKCSKLSGRFFSNFVAFLQYQNFNNCGKPYAVYI